MYSLRPAARGSWRSQNCVRRLTQKHRTIGAGTHEARLGGVGGIEAIGPMQWFLTIEPLNARRQPSAGVYSGELLLQWELPPEVTLAAPEADLHSVGPRKYGFSWSLYARLLVSPGPLPSDLGDWG